MRAFIPPSTSGLLLPAVLFAFAPWACVVHEEQSSTTGNTTASTTSAGGTGAIGSSGTAGAGATAAGGATGAGGTGAGAAGAGTGAGGSGAGAGGSGTAGSTGAGGTAGAGNTTGAGGGMPCTAGMGGCAPGEYCNAPGCGAGVCAPKPGPAQQQKNQALVCGCDGVTYWNESIAAYQGVGVQAMGACPAGTGIACSQAMPCPMGLRCNRKAADASACASTPDGECWGVPIACDPNGPQGHACSNGVCAAECTLIQSQNPWYGPC